MQSEFTVYVPVNVPCDTLPFRLSALHDDRAARIAGANVAPLRRAALFKEAMLRWQIAASNIEYHCAENT